MMKRLLHFLVLTVASAIPGIGMAASDNDYGIRIAGTILGVLIWPPFASIGVLIAAVFIAIMRRGNPEFERD